LYDQENAMLSHGLLARLKSKPSQIAETEQFLKSALPLVQAEPATPVWFALRFGRGEYGIFDAFAGEEGRQAHLQGQVAAALTSQAPQLLDGSLDIERVEVLASKMPTETTLQAAAPEVTCGLLLAFRAKKDNELKVEQFLRAAEPMVHEERGTIAWFALRWPQGRYGIFDVFPDHGARFAHITGHVPRELTKHAFTLLGGMPSMDMLDVLASHFAKQTTTVGAGVV
jgi:quinol monooxygenase YgiN